jgi:hypothetical protein
MILKLDLRFWIVILYYQLSNEKYDIKKANLGFWTVILYYQLSNEKYDIRAGFIFPDCNIVRSIK